MTSSNSQSTLALLSSYWNASHAEQRNLEQPNIDCIVTYAFSWGHDQKAKETRSAEKDLNMLAKGKVSDFLNNVRTHGVKDFKLNVAKDTST